MKHLRAVTPSYDVASWERDRAANKKVMERLRTVRQMASASELLTQTLVAVVVVVLVVAVVEGLF